MKIKEIKKRINNALDRLYDVDQFIIDNDLCERCINFRFALHLQNNFPEYFVDCEYNKSHIGLINDQKRVLDTGNGNFIDIIIGKRSRSPKDDFICFETKKSNSNDVLGIENDINKLKILTSGGQFDYKYGFKIVFSLLRKDVILETYKKAKLL
ncbi:MAG: hypothetical protein WC827_01710 [Candidatus Paceibacterota bacterium]|jgi:hypothetical protein